jgi:imidazolonepropionase-like amidohydrolase
LKVKDYLVRAGKLVTVSDKYKTLYDGAFVVVDGMIAEVGDYSILSERYKFLEVLDYSDYIVTPSLVDCHTHVMEYAPSSIFPVTESTHLMASSALILKALSSGITALGEQICGHPSVRYFKDDYLKVIEHLPIDISFSLSTITIGLPELAHFSGITGASAISKEMLLDEAIIKGLIENSEYPGENIFINATPANFEENFIPRAGEIIYTQKELEYISNMFHMNNKKIGCHVAGEDAIDMAIDAGFDVIHHGHGITKEQIERVKDKSILIVATPLGGTHLPPNSPEEIVELAKSGIVVAISTDGYLPPSKKAPWLKFLNDELKGPESLMLIAHEAMENLRHLKWNENEVLKLITLNPAIVMGRDKQYGSIEAGKNANFLVANGIPGLDITNPEDIKQVFFKGEKIISRI